MTDTQHNDRSTKALLEQIRDHLLQAQQLMDSIDPVSIFGARLQQLIDELPEGSPASSPSRALNESPD